MFRWKCILPLLILIAACGTALARPDLNAFLNVRVNTTAELVQQAEKDPIVMDRYERHFGMSRDQVVAYLSSLHPARLTTDGVYRVYSIPDGGYVKCHVGRLKKGTMMFFTADGDPALIALCGNPVTEGKNATMVMIAPAPPLSLADTRELTFQPPTSQDEIIVSQPPDVEVVDVTPGHDNLAVAPGITALPLAGLLGIGGFGLISSHGGHGGPPVPEPATIAMLAVGVATLIRKRRAN